ncbi:Clp protease N-terminal domain-containing protein [Saxibacter everestensis]|uniref:Clp protease N-terminal domain-containing protein n=1 Tax=Saxibacter everestensis TaxID=2909229 RepID=A0ABY8QPQ6_9MICO|nr:Clp protease N-terminal domain-containing protein [Brevibacteriaceae bacterium ZFBP1038]
MNEKMEPTPRYRRMLAAAEEEAIRRGHGYVGVEHMMLAITSDPDSVAAAALSQSTSLTQVRDDLMRILDSPGYSTPGPPISFTG